MGRKQDVFGVTIEGDISGLQRAMYEAEKLFKQTERSLKNVQKQSELEPGNADVLTKQMELYRKAIEEGQRAARKLRSDIQKLKKDANWTDEVAKTEKFTALELELKKVTDKVKNLKKEYKDLGNVANQVFQAKLDSFYHSLDQNFEAYERIGRSLSNINDAIQLDPTNLDLYRQKQELLDEEIRVGSYLVELYGKNLEKIRNTPGYLKEVEEKSEAFTKQAASIAKVNGELKTYNNQKMSKEAARFNYELELASNSLINIGNATAGLSRAFRGLLTSSFEASKDFETSLANLKRVVADVSDSTIEDLKRMSVETGTAFNEIADYATISGALGLADDQIAEFTKAMVDLNTATGDVFTGEEGAKGIAVFLKQLNLGTDEADNFGSAIVEIGKRYADVGDETVNVATRLSGVSTLIKTNQYELLGLAAVMADLGLATDSNANSINRAFLQIDKILSGGVKNADVKLKQMANTAGMTSDQFRKAWGENAMNAFLKFTDGLKSSVFNDVNKAIENSNAKVQEYANTLGWTSEQFIRAWGEDSKAVFNQYVEALGDLEEEGISASSVLSNLGISSVYTAQTLLRLSGSGNEVREAIQLASDAWSENTALTESANSVYDTTARKLQGMYESLKQLGGTLIDNFAPTIQDTIDSLTSFAQAVGNMNPNVQKLVTYFLAFGAGLSPVVTNLGRLGLWFVKNEQGISKFSSSLSGLKTLITGPVGVTAGISLLVLALAGLGDYANKHNSINILNEKVNDLNESLLETSRIADENFRQSISGLYEGADEYIDKIQEMIEISKDKSLPWAQRNEAEENIKAYVEALNQIIGDELFSFDSATNELKFQGELIEDLKKSFSEYKFEIEKQNWLDAHKEELAQAQEALKISSEEMQKATEDYVRQTQGIPQWVLDLLKENEGSIEALKTDLRSQGFADIDTESWINTLERFFPAYQEAMKKADEVGREAQSYIDKYNEVNASTIENFNQLIEEIDKIPETIQPNFENTLATTEELAKQRQALSTALGDDLASTNLLIEAYDRELEKAPLISEWLANQQEQYIQNNEKINEGIAAWEGWQPSTKSLTIDFSLGNAPSWLYPNTPSIGTNNSGGYGDFREAINQSAFNSGRFRSGGVTVNATFNVGNSESVNRYTLREWGEILGEQINLYLGEQI